MSLKVLTDKIKAVVHQGGEKGDLKHEWDRLKRKPGVTVQDTASRRHEVE